MQRGYETRPDAHPSSPRTGLPHRSKCTGAILSVRLSPALSGTPPGAQSPADRGRHQALPVRIERGGEFNEVQLAPVLRGWRERRAPTHTYPGHRGQSRASIYTRLHRGSPVKWVWWSFYPGETVEKNNMNTRRATVRTLCFLSPIVSQTFFIITVIVYRRSVKSMLGFFSSFCLFLRKKKKAKLKYFSKNRV